MCLYMIVLHHLFVTHDFPCSSENMGVGRYHSLFQCMQLIGENILIIFFSFLFDAMHCGWLSILS
uniref:Uncharacterized protein n=1 Tax=Anguilla anguilla TaxID=7936 RepID=A0A0E9PH10_ANGAN